MNNFSTIFSLYLYKNKFFCHIFIKCQVFYLFVFVDIDAFCHSSTTKTTVKTTVAAKWEVDSSRHLDLENIISLGRLPKKLCNFKDFQLIFAQEDETCDFIKVKSSSK